MLATISYLWTSPRATSNRRHRALARAAGRRGLLGRVVRPLPPARASLERAVADARRARSSSSRSTPTATRTRAGVRIQGIPAVKAFKDGEVVADSPARSRRPAVERFLDSLVPSEADGLVAQGDEAVAAQGARARARPRRRSGAAGPHAARARRVRRGARATRRRPRQLRRPTACWPGSSSSSVRHARSQRSIRRARRRRPRAGPRPAARRRCPLPTARATTSAAWSSGSSTSSASTARSRATSRRRLASALY